MVVPVLLVLLLAAMAGVWWINASRIDRTEREFARRIQDSDGVAKEARMAAKQAQDLTLGLQNRVGVLESKLAESQSQQLALEQLYQDLSRTRDDWALAEVEQILSVASQQLQLAGNVQGAIIGLQNADNRLARADKPQFIGLRRVIQRDLERLNALPNVDLAGNALRIDSLVSMVDSLPLLSDEKPAPRPRLDAQVQESALPELAARTNTAGGVNLPLNLPPNAQANEADWGERLSDALRHAAAEVWQEFQQLVHIRRVDQPNALLLAPDQIYFVRENLKLRLLNARLALLARQETTYRADLLRAQESLQQYFDTRSKQTIAALTLMKQIQASNTVVELPTLAESLSAVRNFKTPREH
jgi:uroporphyrin-3 C-methyltransferase/uroporphyrinogen III methyltransferase/synthase